jgi:hypothetical protein
MNLPAPKRGFNLLTSFEQKEINPNTYEPFITPYVQKYFPGNE